MIWLAARLICQPPPSPPTANGMMPASCSLGRSARYSSQVEGTGRPAFSNAGMDAQAQLSMWMFTGTHHHLPSIWHGALVSSGRINLSQPSFSASGVRSSSRPAAISSSYWRPGLNCAASGGSPPSARCMIVARAVSPSATAPSTHLSPVASNSLANTDTAACSPPEVHQWITSTSAARTEVLPSMAAAARATTDTNLFIDSPPKVRSSPLQRICRSAAGPLSGILEPAACNRLQKQAIKSMQSITLRTEACCTDVEIDFRQALE
jgi:hypothetical protein